MNYKVKESAWNRDLNEILAAQLPWENFSGRRVLVTGATGFLGNFIVRFLLYLNKKRLLDKPVQVFAMVRNIEKSKLVFSDLIDDNNLDVVEWDLNNFEVPRFRGLNYVFHCASQASPKFYGTDPVGTALPNSLGTIALLKSLDFNNEDIERFVFISSSEVYGDLSSSSSIKETDFGFIDPAERRSCYSESKRFGETIVNAWSFQYDTPVVTLRPFHTYGPGLSEFDGRVFSDFAFNVIKNEDIVIKSDGTAQRAFCYATDALIGIFYAVFKGEERGAYNLANPGANLTVKDLAYLMISLDSQKNSKVIFDNVSQGDKYLKSEIKYNIPNVDKLKNLGWTPTVDPVEGFKRMINAYEKIE